MLDVARITHFVSRDKLTFALIGGGVLIRLRDEAKTELAVARDRVRTLKQRLGIG